MHPKYIQIPILISTIFLAGCGFTLRGTVALSPELQTLYLVSSAGESAILQELRRALLAGDISLLDTPREDVYRLELGEELSEERVLSVNSNARAGEYELSLSVPVQLSSGNTQLLGPEVLSIARVYLADPNSAVAKQEERELMEEEIRLELVSQILRRLQNLSI